MIKMQGRYTLENENSSSHSREVTLQTSWFGHREKLSLQSRLRLLNSVASVKLYVKDPSIRQ